MTHDAPTVDPDAVLERRVLVVIGGGAVVERDLPPPSARARLVVGRALDCDVRIDDPAISRSHAVLEIDQRVSLVIESRTGKTRIDGREIAPGTKVVLEPGQLVEIGQSRLVIRRDRHVAQGAPGARAVARPMEATRRAIDIAAKSDLPVLVLGETGAGKEVAMEQIVARSRRSGGPLVRIDCAALPSGRFESEKLFEAATGGTAFLDEIASLPLEMQAQLLRVIEARVVPLKPAEVRFMAATNVDVRARVAEGKFREDLYFRLAGIVISVPPLRERQDEIGALAKTLLSSEAERERLPVPALSEAALALLVAYRWPGNVRELRNVVGRALHVARGRAAIEVADLEMATPGRETEAEANVDASAKASAKTDARSETPGTPGYERARIVAAMDRAKGNQKEAARMLGMTRRMLMYRLDAYGLPRPRKR